MMIEFNRKKYRITQRAEKMKLSLYEKRGKDYVKIHEEDCGRQLSPKELYKRGRELADAFETLEAERREFKK